MPKYLWKSSVFLFVCSVGLLSLAPMASARPAQHGALKNRVGPYEVQVLSGSQQAPTFTHRGQTYLMGTKGARYTVRVINHSARAIEAVVSVDGLDVLDGKRADFSKRGYIVEPYGSVDIDGWRLSDQQVAAFRFAAVASSYASKTSGDRNVGVIGVAIFQEEWREEVIPYPAPYYSTPNYGAPGQSRQGRQKYEEAPQSDGESFSEAQQRRAPDGNASESSARNHRAAPSAPSAPSAGSRGADTASRAQQRSYRPGLGTEFGEARASHIRRVDFHRANYATPSHLLGLRYNDRAGLISIGIDVDYRSIRRRDNALRESATPFPVSAPGYAQPPAGWRYH